MNRRNFLRATAGCAVAGPVAAAAVAPMKVAILRDTPMEVWMDWNDPDNWLPSSNITTFLLYKKNDGTGKYEVVEETQWVNGVPA